MVKWLSRLLVELHEMFDWLTMYESDWHEKLDVLPIKTPCQYMWLCFVSVKSWSRLEWNFTITVTVVDDPKWPEYRGYVNSETKIIYVSVTDIIVISLIDNCMVLSVLSHRYNVWQEFGGNVNKVSVSAHFYFFLTTTSAKLCSWWSRYRSSRNQMRRDSFRKINTVLFTGLVPQNYFHGSFHKTL